MAASGMLAVGASLLVAGLSWMFAHQVELHKADNRWKNEKWLLVLGGFLVAIIIATSTILLARTSSNYFDIMQAYYGLKPPGWVTRDNLFNASIAWIILCFIILVARTFGLTPELRGSQAFVTGIAAFLTAALALVGPVYASAIPETAATRPADIPVSMWALVLCLFVPAAVFLALSLSGPGIIRAANGPEPTKKVSIRETAEQQPEMGEVPKLDAQQSEKVAEAETLPGANT